MDNISIHALCEEGDPENVVISKMPEISIHALCEEGDGAGLLLSTCKQLFLSTPSARRATTKAVNVSPKNMRISIHALCEEGDYTLMSGLAQLTYFYPRPLRGGRRDPSAVCCHTSTISIHALCEEGDRFTVRPVKVSGVFLSTPSARRATHRGRSVRPGIRISIHLCEEGDRRLCTHPEPSGYFYPRPLRGGRRLP